MSRHAYCMADVRLIERLSAFAIKIVLWPTEVAVERCDKFAHLEYTSFSPGTGVSWGAAQQVAALLDAVRESYDLQVSRSCIQTDVARKYCSLRYSFLSLRKTIRVEFGIWMCPPMVDDSDKSHSAGRKRRYKVRALLGRRKSIA